MTEDDINRLESDLETLRKARLNIDHAMRAKFAELNAARVQYALANPHPLIGKQVERQMRHGYSSGTVTRRGTVEVFNPVKHRGVKGTGYGIKPGDPIVVSATGKTAWRFNIDPRHIARGETEWKESSK